MCFFIFSLNPAYILISVIRKDRRTVESDIVDDIHVLHRIKLVLMYLCVYEIQHRLRIHFAVFEKLAM